MAIDNEIVFECDNCGGNYVKLTENQYRCDHCGNTKYFETKTSSEIIALFNQANTLRNRGEFDDAYDMFSEIAKKDPNNSDAYWGLLLSEYGIMHVQDPTSKKYVPTCNRGSGISIYEDENYKKAISLGNELQKQDYKLKAEQLEAIRTKIIELSKNEEPYDVFICYKRTDKVVNGKESYTEDAINARDIYEMLSSQGYKVFFAEKTLQHLAGTEYEPLIYNALNTSKVMLVVCSDPDYINSPWVKNEWRRFIKQTEYDETKKILPIMCGGMKAGRLPDMLKKFQGLEMNVNIQQNLLLSISKIIDLSKKNTITRVNIDEKRNVKKSNVIRENIQLRKIGDHQASTLIVSDEKLLKLALSYISKGMYKEAKRDVTNLSLKPELSKITAFLLSYIQFKMKDDPNLFNSELFTQCIESASSFIANSILECLREDFYKLLVDNNDKSASVIYTSVMAWENEENDKIFASADEYIRNHSSQNAYHIFNAVAKCYDSADVDGYIKLIDEYAELFSKNNDTFMTKVALSKIIDVDEGNVSARWRKLMASFGANSLTSIRYCVQFITPEHIAEFKDFLGYVKENKRNDYIKNFCKEVTLGVQYLTDFKRVDDASFLKYVAKSLTCVNPEIYNKYYKNVGKKIFGKITRTQITAESIKSEKNKLFMIYKSFAGCKGVFFKEPRPLESVKSQVYAGVFDELIKFFTQDCQEDLIIALYQMADACKQEGLFELAIRYYNLIVAERNTEHKAFWGLLQAKLRCRNNQELMEVKKSLSNFADFNLAVQSAGIVDEKQVDFYLSIKQEQDMKRKTFFKANLFKIIRKWTIIGLVAIIAIVSLSIGIYKTQPVVTFYDYKGDVVEVLKASRRGGSVDPNEELYARPDDLFAEDYVLTGFTCDIDNVTSRRKAKPTYTYTPIKYTMNVVCGENGSLMMKRSGYYQDYADSLSYSEGTSSSYAFYRDTIVFEFYPYTDYEVDTVKIDGQVMGIHDNKLQITKTEFEQTIEVTFKLSGYTPISTPDQLQDLSYVSGKFYLANDIDLQYTSWDPIDYFSGVLDGQGHTIRNLTINSSYSSDVGLFGYVSSVIFRNIKLEGFTINSSYEIDNVGCLVGELTGDTSQLEDIEVSSSVISCEYASNVGGVVGYYSGSSTRNIFQNIKTTDTVSVTGSTDVGGLFGELYYSSYYSSTSSAGLVYCYNYADVIATSDYAGGIAGYFRGFSDLQYSISSCGNYGTIKGNSYTGGIAGLANNVTISSVTNNSDIEANYLVGSIVGKGVSVKIISISNSGSTVICTGKNSSGYSYVGGVAGYLEYSYLEDITNNATLNLTNTQGSKIGGICGYVKSMEDTYSDLVNYSEIVASNSSNSEVGGIFGSVDIETYDNLILDEVYCYANVSSAGSSVGGIIGSATSDNYVYSTRYITIYNATVYNVTGNTCVGGIIGYRKSCFSYYGSGLSVGTVTGISNYGTYVGYVYYN